MKYKLQFENGQVYEGEIDKNTRLSAQIYIMKKPTDDDFKEYPGVKEIREVDTSPV
jgi:hypothetical protein